MTPEKQMENDIIEPIFVGVSDDITARNRISEILNRRVNNSDVVDLLKFNESRIQKQTTTGGSKELDKDVIKTSDEKLLGETLENSIHRFALSNVNVKSEKQLTVFDSTDSLNTIKRHLPNNIQELSSDQALYNQINVLKYRENVFRAAYKLTRGTPPFPNWIYKEDNKNNSQTRKINVGGRIFEIFRETYSNISNTKLNNCLRAHQQKGIAFIDRDPVCFNSILNFYRTGKLHVPPNVCLTFFEEELLFWGINEEFLEPCCWSDYQTYKLASNRLKKYSEDSERKTNFSDSNVSYNFKHRNKLYKMVTSGTNSKASRGMAMMCTVSIIIGIFCMIIETTPLGRINKVTRKMAVFHRNDTVTSFLKRTEMNHNVANTEIIISTYFAFELLFRLFLCPSKLEFFSDSLNWVDIVATLTSIIGASPIMRVAHSNLEAFFLILKLPRILRLFRITDSLRSGIGAFTLTIKACLHELKLVFLIMIIATTVFGLLVFCVELDNLSSNIDNIYLGMWWAIVSMGGVGFGDYIPKTTLGYLVGTLCIMSGMIISQMPVTIFLNKFSIYYNQASARLISQSNLLLCRNVDKGELRYIENKYIKIYESKLEKSKWKRFISKVI